MFNRENKENSFANNNVKEIKYYDYPLQSK